MSPSRRGDFSDSFPIAPEDWEVLAKAGVMLPSIPREFGGRDSHFEMCRLIERISEYNLPLGMYVMIALDRVE